jgi:hypothetical protein
VCHQHQLTGAEVLVHRARDGRQVACLVSGGIWVAGRFVRVAPAEEVEEHHWAVASQVWEQPVVEVGVVGEAVHQHDRHSRTGYHLGIQLVWPA